jgi:hypothetical protein
VSKLGPAYSFNEDIIEAVPALAALTNAAIAMGVFAKAASTEADSVEAGPAKEKTRPVTVKDEIDYFDC